MSGNLLQFLTSLPLPLLALVAIGVPMLLALGFGQVIQALFTPQELAAQSAVGAAKYSFIVEVYALVAALALVGAWDIYQGARDNLRQETGRLYMLAVSVPSYNQPGQEQVRNRMYTSIRNYAAAVAGKDWPYMRAGTNRSGSDAEFEQLTRSFMDAEPVTASQQALAQNVSGWLSEIASARIARLSVSSQTFSLLVWLLVLTASVSVLAFQWFVGSSSAVVHNAMAGVIAVMVGLVLTVSAKMAYPFSGDGALLSPQPFLQLMTVGG